MAMMSGFSEQTSSVSWVNLLYKHCALKQITFNGTNSVRFLTTIHFGLRLSRGMSLLEEVVVSLSGPSL